MNEFHASPSEKALIGASHPKLRALTLGFVSCLLFVVAFPPFSLWGSALLAPVPLMLLARNPILSPSRAGLYAAIGMMPAWWWLHQWIGEISALGLPPLVLYLSIYTMLFVWIASRAHARLGHRSFLVVPIVWVAVEFARGVIWTGYPWYFIGHPMIDALDGLLAAPASLGGVHLVSLFVATTAAIIVCWIERGFSFRSVVHLVSISIVWLALAFTLDAALTPNESQETINIGVVQSNVPQDNRTDWTTRQRVSDWLDLRNLTYKVSRLDPKPQLIVWPEGLVPGWTLDPISLETEREGRIAWTLAKKHPEDVPDLELPNGIGATLVVDEMLIMQQTIGIPMIVGSVAFDNLSVRNDDGSIEYTNDAMYNSVFVLDDGAPQSVWYDKMHLTPFGEIMPYISAWPWLENKMLSFGAKGMAFVLTPGKEYRVLEVPLSDDGKAVAVATPICFEATVSAVCRKLVFDQGRRRAAVMINVTNDGWFGDSTGGRISHQLMARWRCVELATPMIRCANTGISGLIDRRGQIVSVDFVDMDSGFPDRADQKAGGFVARVELATLSTPYSKFGDTLGWILLGIALVGAFVLKNPASASPDGDNAECIDRINES